MLAVALGVSATGAGAQTMDAPERQRVVLTAEGRGVQVYKCGADGTWAFTGPEADLFVDGVKVGTHGAGPSWTWQDGSMVRAKMVKSVVAAGTIPWLLLEVQASEGEGVLKDVTYVVRSDTSGGVADVGGCTVKKKGAVTRVKYSAMYTFYAARK